MMEGDRVEVRCKTSGPAGGPWKRGTVLGSPPDWIVQLDDGGHVHPIQIAGLRPFGIPVEAQPDAIHGPETSAQLRLLGGGNTVGSFWGGLAKLANPFSSPLSPLAQARRTVNAFRGGGGSAAPPPSYGPPPVDPSQQFAPPPGYGPPPVDPSQFAPAPSYAPQLYAPAPGVDWSQYSSPSAGWPDGGSNPY